jgi:hypothetical protein
MTYFPKNKTILVSFRNYRRTISYNPKKCKYWLAFTSVLLRVLIPFLYLNQLRWKIPGSSPRFLSTLGSLNASKAGCLTSTSSPLYFLLG